MNWPEFVLEVERQMSERRIMPTTELQGINWDRDMFGGPEHGGQHVGIYVQVDSDGRLLIGED